MKLFLKYILFLFTFVSITLTSCSDEPFGGQNAKGEDGKKEVRVTLNLQKSLLTNTRAEGGSIIGPDDYENAKQYPRIGDGTRATTLIYQLYRVETDNLGNEDYIPIYLPNPDKTSDQLSLHQVRRENISFPHTDIVFTVDNDDEYIMVFWAMSADADKYYDTYQLKNIMVRYDNASVEDASGQFNNQDARDAFCATWRFRGTDVYNNIEIILKRVVSQINIGFTEEAWERLLKNNINVYKSAISIANVGRRYNLINNEIVLPSENADGDGIDDQEESGQYEAGGVTWAYTIADFSSFNTPMHAKFSDETEYPQVLKIKKNDESDYADYKWVSMSYIFAAGGISNNTESGEPEYSSAIVDITDIKFYDKDDNELTLPLTEIANVPVKRNYRTNILIDKNFNATLYMDLNIDPGLINDYNNIDGENVKGEIAPGLTYKETEDPSRYGEAYTTLEFYVSSPRGLKWLADRTNYVDFSEKDIPTWKDAYGNTVTYKDFGVEATDAYGHKFYKPDIETYRERVYHKFGDPNYAFIANGTTYGRMKDQSPWSFDDVTIKLTADIDFATDEDVQADWIGFNGNMSPEMGDGFDFWDPAYPNINNGKTGPDSGTPNYVGRAFKGTFDGQGYTIYNMIIYNVGKNGNSTGNPDPETDIRME